MKQSNRMGVAAVALAAGCLVLAAMSLTAGERNRESALTMVVMDPLAAPLSCPCVEGYAQRKYEALQERLAATLDREVKLVFSESLVMALEGEADGVAHLVIGKDSVVRADAKASDTNVTPVAQLTDKQGSTTQNGLFVVGKDNAAQGPKDLAGYRIFFGPKECDEKHGSALAVLKKAGVAPPRELEIDQACSDGAARVVELGSDVQAAAVISSYAAPLLEGCGTIKKGDLRVIAKTEPMPFVTAFVTQQVNRAERDQIQEALLSASTDVELCTALESLIGFVPMESNEDAAQPAKSEKVAAGKKG